MGGHVNMMDDVLISQLPPVLLRSSLRALVSQGSAAQKVFVDHVRARLRETPLAFVSPTELFEQERPCYNEFLASTRCLFTCKMAAESLPYLTHFLACIPKANTRWVSEDDLDIALQTACGDIVQAIQALKESRPFPTQELKVLLVEIQRALYTCEVYCHSRDLPFPFTRACLQVQDMLLVTFPEESTTQTPRVTVIGASNAIKMELDTSATTKITHIRLGNLIVPRLFNGLWQVSSPAWGSASSFKQNAALAQLVQAGFVAADMADHYGDAEIIYGAFRNSLSRELGCNVISATKWCVFRPLEGPVTNDFVLDAVRERSRRLGGRVELLQFHWYDYHAREYLLILAELVKITKTHPFLVSNIGLCNFDADHTAEVCEYLLSALGEVGIVSNQVQFSLIDARPAVKMAAMCHRYGIRLLTYGSFCGGFLSEQWLDAKSPDVYSISADLTPSQRKYYDMIMTWGTWDDFQTMLRTLKSMADKHKVRLANIATRWLLDRPEVGAVIVGTRLGVSTNVESNIKAFTFRLDAGDTAMLNNFALGESATAVFAKLGDCGQEYR